MPFSVAHVLMLMVVVLAEFGETHGSEALLIERIVIAAAQETVEAEDQNRLHSGIVRPSDVDDVAGKFSRSRVALTAEHSNTLDFSVACRGWQSF